MSKLYKHNVDTYHKINIDNNFLIDYQTQKDLSLDDFYEKFNNTITSFGDHYFYYKINSQTNNVEIIKHTINDLQYLSNNNLTVSLLSNLLLKIGKQSRGSIVKDLWNGLNYKPRFLDLIPYWVILGPTILILFFVTLGKLALWGILGLLVINLIIFINTNLKISSTSGSMNYLIKTLSVTQKIKKDNYFKNLLNYNDKLNRIRKYKIYLQDGVGLSIIGNDLASSVLDYLRIFLCAELFAYYKIYKYLNIYKLDVRKIIKDIGYLDFIINSSKIIKDNTTSYPKFKDLNNINFKSLSHPLIKNCCPYNFDVLNSMIITGMNMAGKSTFMKSVAINQILAMSFGFTFSDEYITSNYYVISSMNVEDDLKNNKSKYLMEAERLLLMQKFLKKSKLLCLIDEILTGTNTVDRIEASVGILKNFIRYKKSIILAATHDKKIAENLFPEFCSYYFDGDLEEKEIKYDYKIKEGIVISRNALQLLEKLGLEIL